MNGLFKKQSILLILNLFILPVGILAQQAPTFVKKLITRTFNTSANSVLVISNQYGNVVLKGWKEKRVLVRITVVAEAKNTKSAQQLLGRVQINNLREPERTSYTTVIDTVAKTLPNGQCRINYEVYLPEDLKLKVSNQFGDIVAGDHTGTIDIDEKFGSFKAGNLTNLSLELAQGNLNITSIHDGKLNIKGFKTIMIGGLSGNIQADFSSGNTIDMGLRKDLSSLTLNADNVNPLNIHDLKNVEATMKIQAVLAKYLYNSVMQLNKEEKQSRTDTSQNSSQSKLKLKKFEQTRQFKKARDFQLITGSGRILINIKASFSVLNVTD
jgi:hypothetical protein